MRRVAYVLLLGAVLLRAFQDDPAPLLRAGRFQEALLAIRSQLQTQPRNVRLLTMQGIALAQTGGDQAALASFRSALAVSPDNLPALEGAAQLEYKRNDPQAFSRLDHLLTINPDDQTAHAMRAALFARSGDCKQAAMDFGRAPDAIGQQPDALRQYGACLFHLKQWDAAKQVFGQLLSVEASDRRAAYALAASQIESRELQQAIETLKAFPKDADALALSANALEDLNRTPEAIEKLRDAILADPSRESSYTRFAELCFTYKSYQAGIDIIAAGLTQLPNSAKLYVSRGILLVQQGKYASAEEDFAKAESINPSETSSSDAAVLALIQASQFDEANRLLDQKLMLHPGDGELYLLKADVLGRQGDTQASIAAAKQAVTLSPTSVPAHDLLARLYVQNGSPDKAIAECRAALQGDPNDEAALYHWLRILNARHSAADRAAISNLTERWKRAQQANKEHELRDSQYRILTEQQ